MLTKVTRSLKQAVKLSRAFSSQVQQANANANTVSRRDKLQFSKNKLVDFGELPQGEIPEALQYDRPNKLTKLDNGLRVVTESYNSPLVSVTVLVNAGTRDETLESSGTSQYIKRLVLRGTESRTRAQIEKEIESMGGAFECEVDRETTSFTLTAPKSELSKVVNLLGDVLTSSLFDKNQIEAERNEVYRSAVDSSDQLACTLESVHYTSFRDHFIGQPVNGIRENLGSVSHAHIKEFTARNYVSENFVVSAVGNVNHDEVSQLVSKAFSKVPKGSSERVNGSKPYFTPSTLFIRDDEMANVNTGVFFNAPTYSDPEYFAMYMFQNLLGEYRADKYTGAHLNASDRQYNTMHTHLGNCPEITVHKTIYKPYSDCAIFGGYLHGNEVFANQMYFLSQMVLTEYSQILADVEVFRARNKLYNDLLNQENARDVSREIATQVLYLNRRVPRSEFAKRVSHMDNGYLSRVCHKWFFDNDVSAVAWGPVHGMMTHSHYNRPIKRSSLGWYGSSQYTIV